MPDRTCVIYNPAAGRGKASSQVHAALPHLGTHVELLPTTHATHAIELAQQAVRDGFTRILAAGGDGTVHEVANGLLRSDPGSYRFSTLPLGSMNDYAFALGLTAKWWQSLAPNLTTQLVDVGVIRSGNRERFFVNGVGVGFNGIVTLESRKIHSLRGLPLYTLAFLRAGWKHFRTPELEVTFDGETVRLPTLALTVNLGQREGGFPVTPRAKLDDGCFDVLHVTDVRRWQLVRYLPALITGKLPTNHPKLRMGTCRTVRIVSAEPLCIHADGEFFCQPDDDVQSVEIELLPRRLPVEILAK